MCLRSAGNRVTIFGEECTSQWGQSNLPVPGPAAIVCDSSKEKKKDKFASLKPLQTWNFLPPCSVLVLDMDVASPAPSCSLVWQQFDSCHTSTDCWIMEGITSTPTGALGAHTGEGTWLSPCPKVPPAAPQSLAPWAGNADPSPAAAPSPGHQVRGQAGLDLQVSLAPYLSPFLCQGTGSQDSWWRKHDPECSLDPSHAVEAKQCLKSSGFTSLFLRPAEGVDSPCRAFPVAGTLVGATVMSQFRLKRNPRGTSLLKATS